MSPPAARIGIAVVLHAGRVLVGVRGPAGPLPGLSEFPGGKCHADESYEVCAVRECAEETGLAADVVAPVRTCAWTYPHGTLELGFVECRPSHAGAVRESHGGFVWLTGEELRQRTFPEANAQVLPWILSRLGCDR